MEGMELEDAWSHMRMLDNRLQEGGSLELTDEVRALLRRTAPTVAISETEADAALAGVESSAALIHTIRQRVDDGSLRLGEATRRATRLEEVEDIEGARQQMLDLLAVEVVPSYRRQAESELEFLSSYGEPIDCSVTDLRGVWDQVRKLHYQINKLGHGLRLVDALRDFLRRAAATVAISEVETESALSSDESAVALLREIRKRMLEGSRRSKKAIYRMYVLRETGDLQGARQLMHEVLTVEVVPHFRKLAEEELKHLDEFEQSRGQQ